MKTLVALALLLTAWTAAVEAACPPPQPPLRSDLNDEFRDANCQALNWNSARHPDGFLDPPVERELRPGTLIDRFVEPRFADGDGGHFFSPVGEPYSQRALPYTCREMVYTVYRVEAPLRVKAGEAAPWFGEPGLAVQYKTGDADGVASLLSRRVIRAVAWPEEPPCR